MNSNTAGPEWAGAEPCRTVCGPHLFPDRRRERALPFPSCSNVAGRQSSAFGVARWLRPYRPQAGIDRCAGLAVPTASNREG